MTDKKMPLMDDHRVALRFTQNEAQTFQALTAENVPEWQREFIRYMWYGKIPHAIWNGMFLKLSEHQARRLLKGEAVVLDEQKTAVVTYLTQVVQTLISRGVLPCADKAALAAVFQLGVDLFNQTYELNQLRAMMPQPETQPQGE